MADKKRSRVLILLVPGLLALADSAGAEYRPSSSVSESSPAVSVEQAPGVSFGEQSPALSIEGTVDRISEFDLATLNSKVYDSNLAPTVELHLLTVSWAQQWNCKICQGLTTNLTVGALSISDDPSRHPADVRRTYQFLQAPFGRLRNDVGAAGNVSAIERISFKQSGDGSIQFGTNYVRVGSTLSKELFGRSAVSRLAVPLDLGLPDHMSLMGRVNQKEQFWALSYRYDDQYQSLKIETWNQVQYNQIRHANVGVGMAYNLTWYSTSWIW